MYEDEDKIIKDLLETNIRQRGDIGGSSIKLGRRIKELERIYGIREGSAGGNGGANQFAPSANGTSSKKKEKELAEKLGIGLDTLKRAKSLTNLSPEIQQLIEQGNISPSTAARLVAKLSPKEQEALIANLPATQKYTQSQVQSYIDKLKQAKNRQRQIHTVKKSVTPTEYNNSNKEIRCYTLTQILDFKQFVI